MTLRVSSPFPLLLLRLSGVELHVSFLLHTYESKKRSRKGFSFLRTQAVPSARRRTWQSVHTLQAAPRPQLGQVGFAALWRWVGFRRTWSGLSSSAAFPPLSQPSASVGTRRPVFLLMPVRCCLGPFRRIRISFGGRGRPVRRVRWQWPVGRGRRRPLRPPTRPPALGRALLRRAVLRPRPVYLPAANPLPLHLPVDLPLGVPVHGPLPALGPVTVGRPLGPVQVGGPLGSVFLGVLLCLPRLLLGGPLSVVRREPVRLPRRLKHRVCFRSLLKHNVRRRGRTSGTSEGLWRVRPSQQTPTSEYTGTKYSVTLTLPLWENKSCVCFLQCPGERRPGQRRPGQRRPGERCPAPAADSRPEHSSPGAHSFSHQPLRWGIRLWQRTSGAEGGCRRSLWPL